MKCAKCGNEFFAGTVCPNCGTPVIMDSDDATVAFDQEVGIPVPGNNEQNNPVTGNDGQNIPVPEQTSSAVFSHNTPQPGDSIYGSTTGNTYAGQPNNAYGNQPNNMYGGQPNNAYGNQPNNAYGNQPNNAYGNQPNNMYGGQPNNTYGNQTNNMYGNPQGNMYGGQNGFNQGTPNYTLKPEEPKKSKAPFIVAASCLGAAVIALILILVLVVFKKDDDDKTEEPSTKATTTENTEAPDTKEPSTEDTEKPTETEEPSTSAPIGSGTLEGDVVYDDSMIQLTVVSVDYTYGYLNITGQIENKTATKVKFAAQGAAINGVSIDGYMLTEVLSGSKAEWSFSTSDSSMEATGIQKITEFTMYFEVYDADTYDTMDLGNFSCAMDLETTFIPKYDLDRFVDIYEDEYCAVSACKDIVYDEDYDAYYTVLCIENKLDIPVSVMLDETYINGVLVDEHLGWDDVIPKSVVYSEVYWNASDLTEECMSFENIEMSFDFFDYDSWEDYTITTISYKTDGVVE